jgi:1-aminocyclopropane-1-carboxylate deaminase/D-cysteine desulfhydrase-like pyridoxal-dependent ACC family enzyme
VRTTAVFADLPRIRLGHFPTPIEEFPTLSERLGVNLLVKREDLAGLAFGGNKVRKLERLLALPEARAADVLLTSGGPQSNHVRETAAAGRRLGKRVIAFLRGSADARAGNLLVDELLGAELRFVPADDYAPIDAAIESERAALSAQGTESFVVPLGAASGPGVAAWAEGMIEVLEQAPQAPDCLVVAAGTGSTAAGLALGSAAARSAARVVGISASWSEERLAGEARRLLAEAAAFAPAFESAVVGAQERLSWDGRFVGAGYTCPTREGQDALELLASVGVVGDLTYTAKAVAGLVTLIKEGVIEGDSTVVYVHSGGAPELFARPPEIVFGRQPILEGSLR